jgi:hypothetical protein
MQTFSASGTERSLAVELILEDVPGGAPIQIGDLPTTQTVLNEGTLVGQGTDGMWHVSKTARLVGAVPASGFTAFQVYNNHSFKAGDLIGTASGIGASGVRITTVAASGTSMDVITVGTSLSVLIPASGILIESSTSGFPNTSTFRYPPTAITTNSVETTASGNYGCGLVVRGRVRESQMNSPVNATIKATLPLIRFV